MTLKLTLVLGISLSLTAAGCCSGGSCWSKPGYQAAPATGMAGRIYTPTETVSPYQQGPATYQSTPANYGGPGTTYGEAMPSYGGSGSR